MLTPEQIFLVIVWALLAFIIQPFYITLKISAKYKDKEWVKLNLALSHETLTERLQDVIMPLLHDELTSVVKAHLQTFKASLMQGPMRDARALNEEIEGYAEAEIQQQTGLPPQIMEEATERIIKKYPALGIMIPFLQKQAGGSAGGRSSNNGGGDF